MGWAPWRAAQGFTRWPRMFLPASLQWLSWEKRALPDLDFSWAPEVLPLIGRLIFKSLVLAGEKGVPKGRCACWFLTSPALDVPSQQPHFSKQVLQTALCLFSALEKASCKPSVLRVLWRAWSQICVHHRCDELDKVSLSQTRGLSTGCQCLSLTGVALASLLRCLLAVSCPWLSHLVLAFY